MLAKLPESLKRVIRALASLPSLGPRQATRLAFSLVQRSPEERAAFVADLQGLANIKICARCYFLYEGTGEICEICANPTRDQSIVMIVEKETDLISLENTNRFRGRYLVLGPVPKIGVLADWQKARLRTLKDSLKSKAKEIILGFGPTTVGDLNAKLIANELGGFTEKLTRLGRGLPTGAEIEFADDETLGSALDGRS